MACLASIILRSKCSKCQKYWPWIWKPHYSFIAVQRCGQNSLLVRDMHLSSNGTWNHYQTLGVEPNAKPEEIKAAYIKLSKEHHPDKSSEKSSEEFLKIANAYEVLGSPKRRIEYDMVEFARSSNINRFATGEYELYTNEEQKKRKHKSHRRSDSTAANEESEEKKLFSVSPRVRQLLSYLYAAIVTTGLLLVYLSGKRKTNDNNNESKKV